MKNILITGHSGFIGSHLIALLTSKHYEITGLSRKISKDPRISEIRKDIQKATQSDVKKNSSIIHLAALTDLTYCQHNPIDCFEVNVDGTQNMLEIARKKDAKLVYVSTSHVYGIPNKLPISEDHPRNASSIYAASKIAAETYCESYSKSYGMDISIMRLFSVYGPESPSHLVTTKIISQFVSKKGITLGNLFPKRDFVYVGDAVRAIEIALKKSRGLKIYNVGTGKSYSILQICNVLEKLAGVKIPIKSSKSKSRKFDIPNIVSNSSKLKRLGWEPLVSIEKGLQITLDWYRRSTQV